MCSGIVICLERSLETQVGQVFVLIGPGGPEPLSPLLCSYRTFRADPLQTEGRHLFLSRNFG